MSDTPETDEFADGCINPEAWASHARKLERQRNAAREALMLGCQWGISSDGYSAEVSSRVRCWVIGGMNGPAPKAPDYYPTNASAMAPPPQRLPSTKDVPGG